MFGSDLMINFKASAVYELVDSRTLSLYFWEIDLSAVVLNDNFLFVFVFGLLLLISIFSPWGKCARVFVSCTEKSMWSVKRHIIALFKLPMRFDDLSGVLRTDGKHIHFLYLSAFTIFGSRCVCGCKHCVVLLGFITKIQIILPYIYLYLVWMWKRHA